MPTATTRSGTRLAGEPAPPARSTRTLPRRPGKGSHPNRDRQIAGELAPKQRKSTTRKRPTSTVDRPARVGANKKGKKNTAALQNAAAVAAYNQRVAEEDNEDEDSLPLEFPNVDTVTAERIDLTAEESHPTRRPTYLEPLPPPPSSPPLFQAPQLEVYTKVGVYLNSRRIYSDTVRKMSLLAWGLDEVEDVVKVATERPENNLIENKWDFDRIELVMKSEARAATQNRLTLSDLSFTESARVEEVINESYQRFRKPVHVTIDVKLKCEALRQKGRPANTRAHEPSSDGVAESSPAPTSRIRTTQLRAEEQAKRITTLETCAEIEDTIRTLWRCDEPVHVCSNKKSNPKLCYIHAGKGFAHYAVTNGDVITWARAVHKNEVAVNVHTPPMRLLNYWVGQVGSCSVKEVPQKDDSSSDMAAMLNFMKEAQKANAQSMVMETAQSAMRQQERREERQDRLQTHYPAPPVVFSNSQPHQHPHQPSPLSTVVLQRPNTPGQAAAQAPAASSPITNSDYNFEVVAKFFDWLVDSAPELMKGAYRDARDVALSQFWNLDDLKSMSDMKHPLYELAIQKGLIDGVVRSFRRRLTSFKPVYRQESAANILQDLQSGGRCE